MRSYIDLNVGVTFWNTVYFICKSSFAFCFYSLLHFSEQLQTRKFGNAIENLGPSTMLNLKVGELQPLCNL